jgi:thiol-disulfide isomerase/thioredoxin
MNSMRRFYLFAFLLLSSGVYAQKELPLKAGSWRGLIQLNDSTQLPFYFNTVFTEGKLSIEINNAEERILVDEVFVSTDSLIFKMPVFDSEFRCRNYFGSLKGIWINHARKDHQVLVFSAKQEPRPNYLKTAPEGLDGKWEVTFSPGLADSSKAIGLFKQDHSRLTGTFLTETGDYRYLEGQVSASLFQLSCFDGSHAYLFRASLKSGKLEGDFYSGATGYEKWIAVRDEHFQLHNPDSLTFLRKGFDRIDFSFKNSSGQNVSLHDPKFRNKVVIVQIMGSWCPNCMDETKYLSELYKRYQSLGLEIEALAFERTSDPGKANENIGRLKKRFGADYEFLVTGLNGSAQASQALPMLNAVMAFPTTIYIDKKGRVRKVYTGFSGPGTGIYYDKFKQETDLFISKLLAE